MTCNPDRIILLHTIRHDGEALIQHWAYVTTDDAATVLAADYFAPAATRDKHMRPGDKVTVHSVDDFNILRRTTATVFELSVTGV